MNHGPSKDRPRGEQPANRIRSLRGITMREMLDRINHVAPAFSLHPVTAAQLANVMRGSTRPTPTMRRLVPMILDVDEKDCWAESALARDYQPHRKSGEG